MDRFELLRTVDIFAGLSDDQIQGLTHKLQTFTIPANTPVYGGPDLPAAGLFLIDSGEVRINELDHEGAEQTTAVLVAGQFFGELSLLGVLPSTQSATTAPDTTLHVLATEDFDQFLSGDVHATREMMRALALRQAAMNIRTARGHVDAEAATDLDSTVIAVFSPKGGAGKSTVAVNLAASLARRFPDSVALLDLSLTFGHGAVLLGLEPRNSLASLAARAPQGVPSAENLASATARHATALRFIPGANKPEEGELVGAEAIRATINHLKRDCSFIVIDTASTFDLATITAIEAASKVLIVVSPELTVLRDVREVQRIFRELIGIPERSLQYVLNNIQARPRLARPSIEAGLGVALAGEIPYAGGAFARAAALGEPLVVTQPKSAAARAFDQLGRKLEPVRPTTTTELDARARRARRIRIGAMVATPAAALLVLATTGASFLFGGAQPDVNQRPAPAPVAAFVSPARESSWARHTRGITSVGSQRISLTAADFNTFTGVDDLVLSEVSQFTKYLQGNVATPIQPKLQPGEVVQGMKALPSLALLPTGKQSRLSALTLTLSDSQSGLLMAKLNGMLLRAGTPVATQLLRESPAVSDEVKQLPTGALTEVAGLAIDLGAISSGDIVTKTEIYNEISDNANLRRAGVTDAQLRAVAETLEALQRDRRAPVDSDTVIGNMRGRAVTGGLSTRQLVELGDAIDELRGHSTPLTTGQIVELLSRQRSLATLPAPKLIDLAAFVEGRPGAAPGCLTIERRAYEVGSLRSMKTVSLPVLADTTLYAHAQCAQGVTSISAEEVKRGFEPGPLTASLSLEQAAQVADYISDRVPPPPAQQPTQQPTEQPTQPV
ncbi:MAG: cyclic nucleotide-binding domain-containing protein, partial [Chloroflexi bacterium]|nr:cyclic nucleotide-binding domain-containing protein [Chloroflexota bacterium]